jgi:copper chaperone
MKRLELTIAGMSCGHCLNAVSGALEAVPGVEVDTLELGRAVVRVDETCSTPDQVADAVYEAGYETRWSEA